MQGGDTPVHRAIRAVYERYEGVNTFPYLGLYAGSSSPLDAVVRCAPEFCEVENPVWTWTQRHGAAEYTEMVSTHSDHLMMEAELSDQLLGEVGDVIEVAGGSVDTEYITGLYLARKAPGSHSSAPA